MFDMYKDADEWIWMSYITKNMRCSLYSLLTSSQGVSYVIEIREYRNL